MRDVRIAAAQLEARDTDKQHNLNRIASLAEQAAGQDAEIVSFHVNNLLENPRILALQATDVLYTPHVTCGLESPMPGRGKIAQRPLGQPASRSCSPSHGVQRPQA